MKSLVTLSFVLLVSLVSVASAHDKEARFYIQTPETETDADGRVVATGKMVFLEISNPHQFYPRMDVWIDFHTTEELIARDSDNKPIISARTGKPLMEEVEVVKKVKWCPSQGACESHKQYADRRCWTCPEPCEKPETRHVYHWHQHTHTHKHSGSVTHSGCVRHVHKRCCSSK